MRGTVRIGQHDVDMLANGASPFIYKRIFKKDFFTAIGDAKFQSTRPSRDGTSGHNVRRGLG